MARWPLLLVLLSACSACAERGAPVPTPPPSSAATVKAVPAEAGLDASVASALEPRWPTYDGRRPLASIPARTVFFEDGAVVRKDAAGKVLWSTPTKGRLGSVRPPDVVVADGKLVVAVDSGLVAFDASTGRQAWRSDGNGDRLTSGAGLVVSTNCSNLKAPAKRVMVARRLADGTEAWRVDLPLSIDPSPIERIGDGFVVVGHGFTLFVDDKGGSPVTLAEELVTAFPLGQDRFVVTDKRIARIDRDGKTVWEGKRFENVFVAGAGVLALPGDDLVVFDYGAISDSGVELVRLSARDGAERWRKRCAPLMVDHSEYAHFADVRVVGAALEVRSQGSYGWFVEEVALGTGVSLRRQMHNDN